MIDWVGRVTGGQLDTVRDESCAQYSRIRCVIEVSTLLFPPITYRGASKNFFCSSTRKGNRYIITRRGSGGPGRWGSGHPRLLKGPGDRVRLRRRRSPTDCGCVSLGSLTMKPRDRRYSPFRGTRMRLWMIVEMQIEILNGGEIVVNCKSIITIWICTGRYRGIQIQSKSQYEFVPRDTDEFEFFDLD